MKGFKKLPKMADGGSVLQDLGSSIYYATHSADKKREAKDAAQKKVSPPPSKPPVDPMSEDEINKLASNRGYLASRYKSGGGVKKASSKTRNR